MARSNSESERKQFHAWMFFVLFFSYLVAIGAANLCIHFVFPRVYMSAYCYVRVLDASNKLFFYI